MFTVCRIAVSVSIIAVTSPWTTMARAQTSVTRAPSVRLAGANRTLTASRALGAIVIDGRLDEPVWLTAQPASDFVQQFPALDQPASQRTDARVVFTSDAVLVAMRMHDSAPDSIVGTLARRDFDGVSDWAHVILDSRLDRRTAFRFAVNPAGVKRDGFITADAEWTEDAAWDAVWDAVARRDSAGWTAEFRIPLSQLRFANNGAAGWGVQFARDVARIGERSVWVPAAPNGGQFVSLFGTLGGVSVAEAPRRLELTPYVVARGTSGNVESGNPLRAERSGASVAGADFKIGITSDLTLTGTLNPDFGQVEADPSQVNLTGGETFFPEARPFFTEGSNLFNYTLGWHDWIFGAEQLFYSRRIGRLPQLDFPDSAMHTSATEPTRLIGAGKLSGRAFGWNVGLLSATTARTTGEYTHAGGRSRHVIEPLTHYGVYRLGRDYAEGSGSVGLMATSTNRQLDENARRVLHGRALAGGLEARQRFGGGKYSVAGHLFGSTVGGSSAAIARTQTSFRHLFQRDPVNMALDSSATALSGLSSEVRFMKSSGEPWRFGIVGRAVTKGFDVNDAGFLNTSNVVRAGSWLGYERNMAAGPLRRWSSYTNFYAQRAMVGAGAITGFNWWNWVEFRNQWAVSGWVERYTDGWSASLLRGGPAVRTSGNWAGFYQFITDPRRRIAWVLDIAGSPTNADGSRFIRAAPGATLRPAPQAELRLQPSVEHRRNGFQFVDEATTAGGSRYLVGDLRQRTLAVTARGSYALTSALTIQAYAQPFLSHGHFARFSEVVNPAAVSALDRVAAVTAADGGGGALAVQTSGGSATIDNPDFSIANLNANVVARWEYRPGSTLFVVWNQGRTSDERGDASLSAMTGQLRQAATTNVLLLKWSHYLGR